MVKVYLDTLVFGLQKIGGVSVYWYEFIKRMINDHNIDLTVLMIKGQYVNENFCKLPLDSIKKQNEKGKNIQILRNCYPIFIHNEESAIFQSTYLRTCKKKGIKNVVTIHDFTHQIYFAGLKKILNTIQKRRAINNADGIICISQNTKEDLLKYYPKAASKKIKVIYNGASDDYKPIENIKLSGKYSILEGKKYFIYVGDRFKYKNFRFLLDILNKRKDLYCVLVGGKDFSREENNRISVLDHRCIRFTKVPNNELNILYNKANCMIYPSLYEGFGIPVLEAMKSGCPVIAFNNSSIPEVLRNSGILLGNNDIEGCLEELKKLEDDSYRENIITNQLEESKYFSWNRAYSELVEFYESILKEDHKR